MRRRYRVLLLAAIVAAFIVPVGFALSLETGSRAVSSRARPASVAGRTLVAQSAIASPSRAGAPAGASGLPPFAEGARLLVVGSAFLGLAALIRRAA